MADLPAPGAYVCKCGNTFTVSDARAERAEAAIQRKDDVLTSVEQYLAVEHEIRHLHDHLGENLGCSGCELLARVRAALDSTDPVEAAPEERKQSDAEWWMQVAVNTANRYGALLDEILRHFTQKGHPGRPCMRTGWVNEETVAQWRTRAANRSDSGLPVDGEERTNG